jgi:hypothetical protein
MTAEPDLSADDVLQAVVVIVQSIQTSRRSNTAICPKDGCLIRVRSHCPACDVRRGVQLKAAVRTTATPKDDPLRPIRWVPKNGIRRPVYDQSEVA